MTHQAVEFGAREALTLIALISLSLAIINLFPFLPLDGGHIFWSLVEKIRGRPVPFSVMERAGAVGFMLVMVLFAVGLRTTSAGSPARASTSARHQLPFARLTRGRSLDRLGRVRQRPIWYFLPYRAPAAFNRPSPHYYLVPPLDPSLSAAEQEKLLRATNDSVIKLNSCCVHHGSIGHHVQNWNVHRASFGIGYIAAWIVPHESPCFAAAAWRRVGHATPPGW